VYTSYSNNSKVYRIVTSKNIINSINIENSSAELECFSLDVATKDPHFNLWHRRLEHLTLILSRIN